ncbi:hypothetical protein P3875_02285 [Myroides sp. JBRI-B21084]|uniref:hypothetical protein n=1 Tax=Myroides sp. JBRI-B21084 TaxID=3119977 RepID=UPI0026E33C74|nr:hypothetical protein [Paenimyroides cloacae]WKW46904.1 hypothetical protein P3875_02285 [Paenimyroides cloacae]
MKNLFFSIIIISLLNCCGNDNKKADKPIETKEVTTENLQKFNSVKDMLTEAGDFSTENGTLKIIDENSEKLHIQVSKPIVKGDLDKVINEIVKRDIIYVAFQTFAQTPTEKITITSIPIDLEDRSKYYEEYKKTVTVTKETADRIMKDELGTNDYSILFSDLNGIQVPSKEFDKLKFEKLDETFNKLK